jgi:hypothetical protein
MADELVSLPVNVLATFGTPAARVAKGASVKVSPPVPVVFSFGSDPVAEGREVLDRAILSFPLRARVRALWGLIPSPIDQNSCAHWRNPMDMMRQG